MKLILLIVFFVICRANISHLVLVTSNFIFMQHRPVSYMYMYRKSVGGGKREGRSGISAQLGFSYMKVHGHFTRTR